MSISIANNEIVELVARLKEIKTVRKQLEKEEGKLRAKLELHMGSKERLITEDGEELLTWAYSNPVKVFDSKRFQVECPGIYESFVIERDPIRRLTVKGE